MGAGNGVGSGSDRPVEKRRHGGDVAVAVGVAGGIGAVDVAVPGGGGTSVPFEGGVPGQRVVAVGELNGMGVAVAVAVGVNVGVAVDVAVGVGV
jgi:hypothetical protein